MGKFITKTIFSQQLLLKQGSLSYQPKQCTSSILEIIQNYHALATWYDPPKKHWVASQTAEEKSAEKKKEQ